jgi:hypothetical protein
VAENVQMWMFCWSDALKFGNGKKNMYFHAIATLPGGRRKSIVNKSEEQMLTDFVIPYVRTGVIRAKWGVNTQQYQVLEMRIFGTSRAWSKASGEPLEKFIGQAKNRYSSFEKKATHALGSKIFRAFIVMPIQGEKFGTQDDQRIYKEYDSRFEAIEGLLGKLGAVAIRIDKEHTLDELVKRIKEEIERASFVIADLTDERPSCYFEAGYAEALKKPIIYMASKESVVNPKTKTHVHFDIHRNVLSFTNHKEMKEKLKAAIERNRDQLFREEG